MDSENLATQLTITASYLRSTISIILLLLSISSIAHSQTLQFSMEVQPELGIEVLQNLNFGTVVTNSGKHRVLLGDTQMGVFRIKALAAQNALLTLEKPDYLDSNENETDRIRLKLSAAYSRKPYEYGSAKPFTNSSLWVSLSPDIPIASSPTWENGYVYIFGDIEVGSISRGNYSGTLVLNVVYQ